MVIVIAIASNIGDVAPDLLKHGVFNKAIYFEVPSPLQRQQVSLVTCILLDCVSFKFAWSDGVIGFL